VANKELEAARNARAGWARAHGVGIPLPGSAGMELATFRVEVGQRRSREGSMATVLEQGARQADGLADRYAAVRALSETLCEPLATEDYVVQSMPDVSPTKWHLAHTSWFFETFILKPHHAGYREIDAAYPFLFNSYYVQAGERHCRAQRGYISRPTVAQVFDYRHHVDAAMQELLQGPGAEDVAPLVEIGLNHEQQHQELMLTDIKHVFSVNPLRPAYRPGAGSDAAIPRPGAGSDAGLPRTGGASDEALQGTGVVGAAALPGNGVAPLRWIGFDGGLHEIGHDGSGFSYDNESPRHRVFLEPYELASRAVTNGEYLEFMAAGGYERAELWLSMGWATVQEQQWSEPFYWERREGEWWHYTLTGMRPVDPAEPASHLSYFEVDAFARWAGARLPTEAEWEVAAATVPVVGNFVEDGQFHPRAASTADGLQQMFGDVWEWTQSQYTAYPGYRAPAGALGEYNGKFMCNQFVLRGGSCATSRSHIRPTYRNFFPPDATWQFTGARLARSL
jgi:formylglycine-generating enzyme required for sulfatase activity